MAISIRNVVQDDADALAHVLVTANDHAFRGLVPDKCLEFTEAESAANWRIFLAEGIPANDIMIVAETTTKKVVGYAWGGPNKKDDYLYRGELRQISVLRDYQGQGIARQLVRHVVHFLAGQHIHSMRVDVLQVSPNHLFYVHLGATLVTEHPYYWDGVRLPAYTYGWEDTQELISG